MRSRISRRLGLSAKSLFAQQANVTSLSSRAMQITTSQSLNSYSTSETEAEWQKREGSHFITKPAFGSLFREDKKSLKEILFTNAGMHALANEYITVDEFLSLPLKSRYYFARLFYEVSPIDRENEVIKEIIDRVFTSSYLEMSAFAKLSYKHQEVLIDLLTIPSGAGIEMLNAGVFNLQDFFSFAACEQQAIISLAEDYQRFGASPFELDRVIRKAQRLVNGFTLPVHDKEIEIDKPEDINRFRP